MSKTIISKICSSCKQTKTLNEFSRNKSSKDGHHNQCKVCKNKVNKAYRQTEKAKQNARKYMRKRRKTKKGQAYEKRYWRSEAGIINRRKARKKFYKTEKGKQARRKYCKDNPEKRQAKNAVNYAIKIGKLPRPDTLQCHYYLQNPNCEKQAKQYHHHKGYAPEHWLDVIPVCIPCHSNTFNQPRTIRG